MTDFASLTALDAVEGLKARKFTAADYVSALADRIEAREPDIQAWAFFDRELALEQARRVDALDQAAADYPLFGAPIGVKDIIDTADSPTENGTPLDAGRQPFADAAVIRLLRQAGAIIMGKTVTTELAFLHPARTRNPHNLAHTPGGSSSGSAAAVAAGAVPIALGTQTNGSVIRPASFCGIYALKPTNGLFSGAGVLEQSATLDTIGIFARSLADVAAVAEVLAAPDPRDASARLRGRPSYLRFAQTAPAVPPRLTFVKTPFWPLAEDATKDAFRKLCDDLMPHCEELELPEEFGEVAPLHRTVNLAELALNYAPYYERGKDALSDTMRKVIEEGRAIAAVDYGHALKARERLYRRLDELIQPYDAIVTPSSAGPAPHGLQSTGNPIFCTLWTYLGTPALNVPLLKANGLPLGIQLTGRRFDEARLFRAAGWLAQSLERLGYRRPSL